MIDLKSESCYNIIIITQKGKSCILCVKDVLNRFMVQ